MRQEHDPRPHMTAVLKAAGLPPDGKATKKFTVLS